MALSRRGGREQPNAWPGYVDALSTLLMVLIFVLLVFVLAQGFLSVALSSRDQALDRLNRQVAELAELLALERGQGEELRGSLSRLTEELRGATAARDTALSQLSGLRDERDRQGADRDALRAERDRLAARLADLEASAGGATARIAALEANLAAALSRAEAMGGDTAQSLRGLTEARRALNAEREALAGANRQIAELQARATGAETSRDQVAAALAAAQRQLAETRAALEAMQREKAALDTQVLADRDTIQARLSDIARLSQQVQQLTALRDELERRAEAALARAGQQERANTEAAQAAANALQAELQRRSQAEAAAAAATEAQRRAEAEGGNHARLAESARAQVALLTRQLQELRAELSRIAGLLDAQEAAGRDKDAQISLLGQRLNSALAARVEELQRYRSDFFGRLREVLGDRPEVRIVGDRFIFQSEVLFPVGSAELSAPGQQQLRALARVLLEISARFPADLPWVLRVDGHADRSPIRGGGRFATNWELSSARAIAVAQLLIAEGLAPDHVAATAFAEFQPLDNGDTPEAMSRNRRIELRLTDR
jgi:chemotaxis protein MotB